MWDCHHPCSSNSCPMHELLLSCLPRCCRIVSAADSIPIYALVLRCCCVVICCRCTAILLAVRLLHPHDRRIILIIVSLLIGLNGIMLVVIAASDGDNASFNCIPMYHRSTPPSSLICLSLVPRHHHSSSFIRCVLPTGSTCGCIFHPPIEATRAAKEGLEEGDT